MMRGGGSGGGCEADAVVSKVESASIVSLARLNPRERKYSHSVSEEDECIIDRFSSGREGTYTARMKTSPTIHPAVPTS